MKRAAPFLVLFAAVLWGSVGMFTRFLYQYGFDPFQVSALKSFVAAVTIVLFLLITKPSKLKISIKHIKYFIISGIFGMSLLNVCVYTTMQISTLAIAMVLLYTAPLIVMVAAIFLFNEKFTKVKAVALILAITGCCLITGLIGGAPQTMSFRSILIGAGAGVGYAIYSLASRYALKYYDSFTTTAYTFIFASIGMIPFISIPETVSLMAENPTTILLSLALGIICTIIPYTVYVFALNYMEVGKASILTFFELVVQTVIGILLFNESLSLSGGIAIVLIFGSVVLLNINFNKNEESPANEEAEIN